MQMHIEDGFSSKRWDGKVIGTIPYSEEYPYDEVEKILKKNNLIINPDSEWVNKKIDHNISISFNNTTDNKVVVLEDNGKQIKVILRDDYPG